MTRQPDAAQFVPRSTEELTPRWLTAALRRAGTIEADAEVRSRTTERIGIGSGYVAQLWRVRPRYAPAAAGPSSMVAKLPAPPELLRSWWAGYERELRFYRDLAPAVPLRTPRYLGGVLDVAAGLAAILLEDIGEPSRASHADEGVSLAQAEAVVDMLATLHAAFWRRDPPDWLAVAPDEAAQSLAQYTREGASRLPRYAERDPRLAPALLDLAPRLHEVVATASLRLRDAPQTLIHGDVRPDNLLAGADGDLLVIDWQGVAWNAGAFDVAYFLGQGLPSHLRRAHEQALLARYLEGLAAAGIDGYDGEALWRDYRLGLVVSLFSPVGWAAELHAAGALRDHDGLAGETARGLLEHGVPLLRSLAARNFAAVEDTRALELI